MKHKAVLLLGSNLGDRAELIQRAIEKAREKIGVVIEHSKMYETEPWGERDQPAFFNQAIVIETNYDPFCLLKMINEIEKESGRVESHQWGPRHMDIDIIFYEQAIIKTENLIIPHPFFDKRNFALIPLLEIIPYWLHPVLNKTVEELYLECEDPLEVILIEEYGQSSS